MHFQFHCYRNPNRADLSRRDDRDTPFASSYLPGITSRQLSQQYRQGNQMASCLTQSGGQAGGGSSTGPAMSPATSVN